MRKRTGAFLWRYVAEAHIAGNHHVFTFCFVREMEEVRVASGLEAQAPTYMLKTFTPVYCPQGPVQR